MKFLKFSEFINEEYNPSIYRNTSWKWLLELLKKKQ